MICITAKVAKDFTNGKDPEKQLREALIEANGGSSKITARSLRDHGRELFAMIEVAVEPILRERDSKATNFQRFCWSM